MCTFVYVCMDGCIKCHRKDTGMCRKKIQNVKPDFTADPIWSSGIWTGFHSCPMLAQPSQMVIFPTNVSRTRKEPDLDNAAPCRRAHKEVDERWQLPPTESQDLRRRSFLKVKSEKPTSDSTMSSPMNAIYTTVQTGIDWIEKAVPHASNLPDIWLPRNIPKQTGTGEVDGSWADRRKECRDGIPHQGTSQLHMPVQTFWSQQGQIEDECLPWQTQVTSTNPKLRRTWSTEEVQHWPATEDISALVYIEKSQRYHKYFRNHRQGERTA
jgi:hypothetical protein